MTPCLRPDELIDLLDDATGAQGAARADGASHLASCARCRTALADLREVLSAVANADVPEPSPRFWPQVNARVRATIDAEALAEPAIGWFAWLRWDVVVPMAGLTAMVLTLASAVGRVPAPAPVPSEAGRGASNASARARSAVEPLGTDAAFDLVLELASSLPDSAWDTLGWPTLPDLGEAAGALTPEEQQALHALLRAALERPVS